MEWDAIKQEEAEKQIIGTTSWKATGPDLLISNYSLKKFTATHVSSLRI